MNTILRFLLSTAVLVSFASFAQAEKYTLIYSGNLDGELEPCGCSIEGNSGGILRRAQILDELRGNHADLFVISSGGLLSDSLVEERLKSQYILKGFAQLGYDAVGVQWSDIRYGVDFTQIDGLQWASSNWLGNEFSGSQIITHGQKTLAYFSWLPPEKSPYREMQGNHRVASSDKENFDEALRAAREREELVVVSTGYSLEQAKQRLPLEWVDILLIESAYEEYSEPKKDGKVLVLQPGSRGLRLGQIDFEFESGKGVVSWEHEVISMPPAVANAKRLEGWYQAYNDDVAKAYQESIAIRKAARKGDSPFIGEKACKACHVDSHALFKKSRHAKAFSTLERVNKAFDPECIACHSVGFNQPGGFIDVESTKHLKNVQCESCHGAGRAHAESNGQAVLSHHDWLPEQMCAQCHTQPHSPSFNFADYFSKIRH